MSAALTISEISAKTGMSYRKLAERFHIPHRTMENWSAGIRKPPEYILLMMQEILGI